MEKLLILIPLICMLYVLLKAHSWAWDWRNEASFFDCDGTPLIHGRITIKWVNEDRFKDYDLNKHGEITENIDISDEIVVEVYSRESSGDLLCIWSAEATGFSHQIDNEVNQ